MAKQVRVRRDTLTNLNAAIPADGEIGYNLTDDRIHIGDGSTYGGIPHLNFRDALNNKFTYIADSGSANTVTLTLPYSPGSYATGLIVRFKANAANTGATTINVNSLGAKNLYKYTAGTLGNIASGDITAGGIYEAVYDGTQFQLLTIQKGGITTVKQGDLSTSTGTFSSNANSAVGGPLYYNGSTSYVTAPGGQYGFLPTTQAGVGTNHGWWIGSSSSGSYVSGLIPAIFAQAGASTVYGTQRYITSSPPFDLCDQGEAAGFIFGLLDPSGDLFAHYAADVPPWAYNGPTQIRADRICPVTFKKYRKAIKKRSLEEIMDGAAIVYEDQEITQKIKNADMAIIPHPFGGILPGQKVVMLDPYDDRIRDIIALQNAGGGDEIINALKSGKIKFDNDPLDLKGPDGVQIARMKFKYSGKGK